MLASPDISLPLDLRQSVGLSLVDYVSERRKLRAVVESQIFPPAYTASPKQQRFHDATARHVLFGGSAGPGKTYAMIHDAIAFARRWSNTNICFLRRTFSELEETVIVPFLEHCPQGWLTSYNGSQHLATFPNGTRIWFRHFHNEKDLTLRQGPQYQRVYFDELTHFSERMYDWLDTRLRCLDGRDIPLQIKSASNPGGEGHAWVKRRFVDDATRDADHSFIPALLADNPGDTTEYQQTLDNIKDHNMRAALRDGRWDVFEGQYFTLWRPDLHACEPFEIPRSWPKVRAIDYGGSAPFVCKWMAADPGESPPRVYVYREHYEANRSLEYHVNRILDLSIGETYRDTLADPSMFARTQERGNQRISLASQALDLGLRLSPAANDRVPGWTLMKEQMGIRDDGLPGMIWFSTCFNSVRTMPELVYDKRHVEDLDTTGEDHAADADRYGLPGLLMPERRGLRKVGVVA